jgi:hypothetical protein
LQGNDAQGLDVLFSHQPRIINHGISPYQRENHGTRDAAGELANPSRGVCREKNVNAAVSS